MPRTYRMTGFEQYPKEICLTCGQKHGRRSCGIATWTVGVCDLCGKEDMLTEPRDFGHLKDSWKEENHAKSAIVRK